MELKDIKGYEGRYMVSDEGNIYSLCDFANRKQFKEKKQCVDKYGYKYVALYIDGVMKHMTVHRAVAMAFIPNENNLPQVNHKDGNKENNCVANLEWCTCQENIQHAYDNGLNIPHQSAWKNCYGGNHPKAKKVRAIKDEKTIIFNSAIEASKYFNVSKGTVAMAINRNNLCKGWKVNWIKDY